MVYRLIIILLLPCCIHAQHINILQSGKNVSLRGLSVVNDRVIWASGSSGTVARSTDGGQTWKWMQVKGFEKTDFRDIEAFDGATAIIMGVGSPAYILKTVNGGQDWKLVFEDHRPEMFLDAMEFWNEESGIVIGDPQNGKIFIGRSFDGGSSWQTVPDSLCPQAAKGEAMFAASGTNIRSISLSEAAFVTGGLQTRLFLRDNTYTLPLLSGKESTGANSLAGYNGRKRKTATHMVVVGGDFSADSISAGNCAYSRDGGKTWQVPATLPSGYKSSVEYITKKQLISCGTSGVDISKDGGDHWTQISRESFHVCRKAKNGKSVYLAGKDGRIARLEP